MKFRKRAIVVEAHQWFMNGDHPEDHPDGYDNREGRVVRYFRRPGIDGMSLCGECGKPFHIHGWIDTKEDGHRVCPGDWIITGIAGERYPCKDLIFRATYDLISLRPQIVCLCGSTKFKQEFIKANYDFTMRGYIVLTVGLFAHADGYTLTESEKKVLDELHKRKIDLADKVYVLNVGGYIGNSTRSEIEYAMLHGKPVEYLEADAKAKDSHRVF